MEQPRRLFVCFAALIAASPLMKVASPALAVPNMASASARVCHLMPTEDLARLIGGRPTSTTGLDAAAMSTCTAEWKGAGPVPRGAVARVQHGAPSDISMALAAYRAQGMQVRQFGGVSCFGGRDVLPGSFQSSCVNPKGYTVLTVVRGGSMVPFDIVRKLLTTAQAKI